MAFTDRELLPGVHHIEDALGVCCTLLVGRERALLVDTGYGVEDLGAFVRGLTDQSVTVWLTHGHHDHALGTRFFDDVRILPEDESVYGKYTGPFWRGRVLNSARARGVDVDEAEYMGFAAPAPTLCGGGTMDLGGMTAQILPCPGHTPGSSVVHVPERRLLLTGDDWNPVTWLFFEEALGVRELRENLRGLLELPFEHVICPHRTELYPRSTFESFVEGLTDEVIAAARRVDTGAEHGVDTVEAALPGGQTLVFDERKAKRGRKP